MQGSILFGADTVRWGFTKTTSEAMLGMYITVKVCISHNASAWSLIRTRVVSQGLNATRKLPALTALPC